MTIAILFLIPFVIGLLVGRRVEYGVEREERNWLHIYNNKRRDDEIFFHMHKERELQKELDYYRRIAKEAHT